MHYFDKEKQIDLIRKYKENGDIHALNLLVRSNEKLVISMARKIKSSNNEVELDDLIQEGFIGMMDAVRKFDSDRGANFATFASYSIRNRIGKFLMANKSILKFSTSNDGRILFQKHPVISRKLDKEDLTEEQKCKKIAKELDVKLDSVRSFRQNIGKSRLSLDSVYGEDGSNLMGTIVSDEDLEGNAITEDMLKKVLSVVGDMKKDSMSDLELRILEERYLNDERKTFSSISKDTGFSIQHISNTEKKLLQKIRLRVISDLNLEISGE